MQTLIEQADRIDSIIYHAFNVSKPWYVAKMLTIPAAACLYPVALDQVDSAKFTYSGMIATRYMEAAGEDINTPQ